MTPKKLNLIMIGLLGGALVVGAAGCIYGYTLVNIASQKLSDILVAQEEADQQLSNLSTTNSMYRRSILPIIDQIETAIPKSKNQTEVLAQLQKAAAAAGVTLSSVSFTSVSDIIPSNTTQTIQKGSLLVLPVTFRVEGTFRELQSFLARVEGFNRVATVTSLSVTKDNADSITYEVAINTYLMP